MGADSKAAARLDLLFRSARFNLSAPRDHFINPCCFGDDAAQWFVDQLRSRGLTTSDIDQEDWGWYFNISCQGTNYLVGVGGTPDVDSQPDNRGEWRLIVEKHRTLWQKMTQAGLLTENDPLIRLLERMISAEPDLTWIGIE